MMKSTDGLSGASVMAGFMHSQGSTPIALEEMTRMRCKMCMSIVQQQLPSGVVGAETPQYYLLVRDVRPDAVMRVVKFFQRLGPTQNVYTRPETAMADMWESASLGGTEMRIEFVQLQTLQVVHALFAKHGVDIPFQKAGRCKPSVDRSRQPPAMVAKPHAEAKEKKGAPERPDPSSTFDPLTGSSSGSGSGSSTDSGESGSGSGSGSCSGSGSGSGSDSEESEDNGEKAQSHGRQSSGKRGGSSKSGSSSRNGGGGKPKKRRTGDEAAPEQSTAGESPLSHFADVLSSVPNSAA